MDKHTLVVLIPVGPGTPPEFLNDNIESVLHYCLADALVVLIDDSQEGLCGRHALKHPRVRTLMARPHNIRMGCTGRVFVEKFNAMRTVAQDCDFDLFLSLDTDALIIGPGLERAALERFERHPTSDALGDYLYTYDGSRRPPHQYRHHLDRVQRFVRGFKYPDTTRAIRRLVREATATQRYVYGELLMGGSILYRRRGIERMLAHPFPDLDAFRLLSLSEDCCFTLLLRASGCTIEDFGRQDEPFAIDHNKMPMSPEETLRQGKKLVHSVRRWEDMDEAAVRAFYRAHRAGSAPVG